MNLYKSTGTITQESITEKVKVQLLYTDRKNHKTFFTHYVHAPVEEGQSIKMGHKGTPTPATFFSGIANYPWSDLYDHDVVVVEKIF